jgi:hypothetical protein
MLGGPRVAIVDSLMWPFLGFIFFPWTTVMFVIVAPSGSLVGFDWLWRGLAIATDLSVHVGSGYGGRGYSAAAF